MAQSHRKSISETVGRGAIHPFPARMAPGIALEALGASKKVLRVLDPMAGSGTVIAVARAKGHRAFGVDLDPLAVLLARVWTRAIQSELVLQKAEEVLRRARSIHTQVTPGKAYPRGADLETRRFIRYWFDVRARKQLTALSSVIRRLKNETIRELLWCGLSRLIITKSSGVSLAMDLSHSRPHKVFATAPVMPFDRFLSAVQVVASNCPQIRKGAVGPAAVVKLGDARRVKIASSSIDLVLTSPPYLNAIDYMRCSKFSLVWMGYSVSSIRKIRSESVGTEASSSLALSSRWIAELIEQLRLSPKLSKRNNALLARYVWDMSSALSETSRVLKKGGRAVYVVGDSTVKGTFVSNSTIVAALGKVHGLALESRYSRSLPANRRYLPPPKVGAHSTRIEARMRREVVLTFTKSSR